MSTNPNLTPSVPPCSGGSRLPLPELEQAYDTLARAIDTAGDKSELMLVKLALLLTNEVGEGAVLEAAVENALRDL